CNERNILVSNAAGFSNESVAELAIGMILSVYRKIVGADAMTRFGGDRGGFLGTELNGKTLGIIGAGEIGLRVAEIAKVFRCKVLAYSRSEKSVEGLISTEEFKLMKPEAILINTARGPVVDSEALCVALEESEIAGAAVDVYEKEPPLDKEHILFTAPNLIMLPHIAYATHES
ncbi:hydroxyacid dehydrogenase, partial [Aduncisulcus paluster]